MSTWIELAAIGGPFLAIGACIGFVLGWTVHQAHADLCRFEDAEAERQAMVLQFPERPGA